MFGVRYLKNDRISELLILDINPRLAVTSGRGPWFGRFELGLGGSGVEEVKL